MGLLQTREPELKFVQDQNIVLVHELEAELEPEPEPEPKPEPEKQPG